MTTIRIDLPVEVILDLPPATMAALVNPVRLRALLSELSDEEVARLFQREAPAPAAPEPAPLVAKKRGPDRAPRKPRQLKGSPVAVSGEEMTAALAALHLAEPSTAEQVSERVAMALPTARRALEILAANGRALLGEDGYRRVPGQG